MLKKIYGLAYGTGNLGIRESLKESFEKLDVYTNYGGILIDTAHIYSDWIPCTKSTSEKVIGKWMSKRKNRDKLVISTKGAHPVIDSMGISRVTKKDISKDLKQSLEYLQTDYIDLYFLHRDNENIEIEEIIDILESFKKEGIIKHYGLSNYRPKRLKKAIEYHNRCYSDGLIMNQASYSLRKTIPEDKTTVKISFDDYNIHKESKLSLMTYTPLDGGYFSKINRNDINPDNEYEKNLSVLLAELSNKYEVTISNIILAYLRSEPEFNVIPIIGTGNLNRIRQYTINKELKLNGEDYKKISSIYWNNWGEIYVKIFEIG